MLASTPPGTHICSAKSARINSPHAGATLIAALAVLVLSTPGWGPVPATPTHHAVYLLGTAQRVGGQKAGLSRAGRRNAAAGISTHIVEGPKPFVWGSVGRRVRVATEFVAAHQPGKLDLIGYSRGAIAAIKAARVLERRGHHVGVLITVDPKVRSRFSVPGNTGFAINISNGGGFVSAEIPERTTTINLRTASPMGHVGRNSIDEYVSGFVARVVSLYDDGELSRERVQELARQFGLVPLEQEPAPMAIRSPAVVQRRLAITE